MPFTILGLLYTYYFCIVQATSLWSSKPATYGSVRRSDYILKTSYPIGNGKLGALPFGNAGAEKINFNVDSLWVGGGFENSNYKGGNPSQAKYPYLDGIRQWIFANGTGNVSRLLEPDTNFGYYRVLGNLSVSMDGITNVTLYRRSLDLGNGLHTTEYKSGNVNVKVTSFCSYPAQVCVYHIDSDHVLPRISISFENKLVDQTLLSFRCEGNTVRMTGRTQRGPPVGMKYDALAKVSSNETFSSCISNSTLTIAPTAQVSSATILFAAGTDYDQKKGNKENGYSFRGSDPGPALEATITEAATQSFEDLRKAHVEDYSALQNAFSLELPDIRSSSSQETASVVNRYKSFKDGDPYLESLLFQFARYLFISSSRENSLPPNLQGVWTEELYPPWNCDFHANINLQMNHWFADQTGLGGLQVALWNYMTDTWVPRGIETAQLVYNASGWVTHPEGNPFGHTGMRSDAEWANDPAAAAWMMQHVWDNFEYSQDIEWYKRQGYPLIKGVAQFWLSQLQKDTYSKDGTLVVNPCNSPEHGPTTFACTHYQQVIHQVFEAVLRSASILNEKDQAFVSQTSSALASLDKGLHIGSWGEIKEWKLPDRYGYDFRNDTHRHLSHLVGWYPGYSISSYLSGYSNSTIQSAISTSLLSRGTGDASDANAGWAKVWRAACWARLNDTDHAFGELRLSIATNFAPNGFSMYTGPDPPFQIDANFGLAGAIMAMLVVDLPAPLDRAEQSRTVVLGPAIPSTWGNGKVRGLRLRGGGSVDFEWNGQGVVTAARLSNRTAAVRLVNKAGLILAET